MVSRAGASRIRTKVDKVLGFCVSRKRRTVRDVAAETPPDDDVPGGPKLVVDGALDEGSHVFFERKLHDSIGGDLDDLLLHIRVHIDIFDHRLGHVRRADRAGGCVSHVAQRRCHVNVWLACGRAAGRFFLTTQFCSTGWKHASLAPNRFLVGSKSNIW